MRDYIRGVNAIFKKDLRSFFVGPLFYILCGLVFFILSWNFLDSTGMFLEAAQSGASAMMMGQQPQDYNIRELLFLNHYVMYFWMLFFVVAAISVKLLAEEKKNQTFDLLWTSPVTPFQIILGKFFAGFLAMVVLTTLIFSYPLSTYMFADLEWAALGSAYLGLLLLSGTFVAVGLFVSSLTSSAVITFVATVVIYLGLLLIGGMGRAFDGVWWAQAFFNYVSIATHLESFLRGVVKLSSVVFLFSFMGFWLFLAEGSLKFSAVNLAGRKLKLSSKIMLGMAFLCIVTPSVFGSILRAWPSWFWFPLGVAALAILFIVIIERDYVLAFFSSKAAAKDVNVGTFLLLSLVFLSLINYVGYKNDQVWDLTKGQVNSLSSQSVRVLSDLDEPLTIVALYQDDEAMKELDTHLKPLVDLYRNASPQVRYERYNVLQRPELVEAFRLSNQEPLSVFVQYQDQAERVTRVDESGLTTAIAKAKDILQRTIYFTTGHGEYGLSDGGRQGISGLSQELERMNYKLELLDLSTVETIPDDASFVAIWGPRSEFTEGEMDRLREYVNGGGRLFIAADPLERHNLSQLTKNFGIRFDNTVILNEQARVLGLGPTYALGRILGGGHDITRLLPPDVPTMFVNASPLREDMESVSPEWSVVSLVSTVNEVQSTTSLGEGAQAGTRGVLTLAAISEKLPGPAEEAEGSDGSVREVQALLVVGDSNFLTNQFIGQGNNIDLAFNMVYYMSRNQEVMGVQARQAVGTQVRPKITYFAPVFYSLIGLLPIIFFGSGSLVWLRRRAA